MTGLAHHAAGRFAALLENGFMAGLFSTIFRFDSSKLGYSLFFFFDAPCIQLYNPARHARKEEKFTR
jgi:hypothetical protein